MENLYSPENIEALAQLLVKTWRSTQYGDGNLLEPVNRAAFLAGANPRGYELIRKVDELL